MSSTVIGVDMNLSRRATKPTVGTVTAAASFPVDRLDTAASQSTTLVLPLFSGPTTSTPAGCLGLMAPR